MRVLCDIIARSYESHVIGSQSRETGVRLAFSRNAQLYIYKHYISRIGLIAWLVKTPSRTSEVTGSVLREHYFISTFLAIMNNIL